MNMNKIGQVKCEPGTKCRLDNELIDDILDCCRGSVVCLSVFIHSRRLLLLHSPALGVNLLLLDLCNDHDSKVIHLLLKYITSRLVYYISMHMHHRINFRKSR